MLFPSSYAGGKTQMIIVFIFNHFFLLLFSCAWVFGIIFGVTPWIWTNPVCSLTTVCPSDIGIYSLNLNGVQQAQTYRFGLTYWFIMSDIFTVFVYGYTVLFVMIGFKSPLTYAPEFIFFIIFGLIPDIVKSIYYSVVYFLICDNTWYCMVPSLRSFQFVVLYLFALSRLIFAIIHIFFDIQMLKLGQYITAKEEQAGIFQQ
jgi:hypothetical protein